MTRDECYSAPEFKALKDLGLVETRETFLRFDLTGSDFNADWADRLVVDWPPPERSRWRWADRNKIAVSAIHEHNVLSANMPDWERLILTWKELGILPQRWRAALSEWRGAT